MSKVLRLFLYLLSGFILLAILGIGHMYIAFPDIKPAKDITVQINDDMLARGDYLANHVAVCIDCHSMRDWYVFSGPIVPGTEGQGGEVFDENMGLPGRYVARNITPHGIGGWTDGEIYRSITGGVDRSGDPLFPIMPYQYYRNMDRRDVMAVIAYLRELKPIASDIDPPHTNFPMNLVMRTFPGNPPEAVRPEKSDTLDYGKYLLTISGCAECHTPKEHGQPVPGQELAGGSEFPLPTGGTVRAANITPDPTTGIGSWTADALVERFKYYARPAGRTIPVSPGQFNTVMPWTMYSGMEDYDLRAIYTYLQSVEPVVNSILKFTPPANNRKTGD